MGFGWQRELTSRCCAKDVVDIEQDVPNIDLVVILLAPADCGTMGNGFVSDLIWGVVVKLIVDTMIE